MHETTPLDFSRIAQDLQIRKLQVESAVQLLDEGNTVPFIARYRGERTGGLAEDVLRQIRIRVHFQRQLADRKQTILKSIESQGKLGDDLRQSILKADTTKRLEDLYLPYKPKKKSQASAAREKGLEPLASAIWHTDAAAAGNLDELFSALVNPDKDLKTADDVKAGVQQILAEYMADAAELRGPVRILMWETGKVTAAKSDKVPEGEGQEYKDYFEFAEAARQIPPHRILGLHRAEKDNAVKVKLEIDLDRIKQEALLGLAGLLAKVQGKMPAPKNQESGVRSQESTGTSQEGGQQPTGSEAASTPSPEIATASPEPASPAPSTEPASASPETPPVTSSETPPESPPSAPPVDAALAPVSEPKPLTPVAAEPIVAGHEFATPHAPFLRTVLEDAMQRLIVPSLEREIRKELNDEAEVHAVSVFARNLRSLLMQPPLRDRRVLAIDPGFRTGCKVAVLDEHGNLLDQANIYPFGGGPRKPREKPAPKPAETAAKETEGRSQEPEVKSHEAGTPATPPSVGESPLPAAEAAAAAPTESAAPTEAAATQTPTVSTTPESPAPPSPEVASVSEATPETSPAPVTPPAVAAESVPPPPDKKAESKAALLDLVQKHDLHVVALGNGPGCREMEELLAELVAAYNLDLSYAVVNEAGVGGYAVGPIGREEFPDHDAPLRSAISIGRRLQNPLHELVKVEPQNLGVGLYPQDLARRELRDILEGVVETCVNQVGADVNSAGVTLLRHISGLNQLTARELVDYRKQHGPFQTREQLLQVPGLGQERFLQAAGFLTVHGPHPLDRTGIHPECYPLAEQILSELGFSFGALSDANAQPELLSKLNDLPIEEFARRHSVAASTVYDVAQAMALPPFDPRADLPPPIFRKGLLKLDDLQPGMELKGTVLNVVDFGAFVDVGMKDSGLVHISQMANRYIKSPHDVAAVNDIVTVWVLSVDRERGRVSLTMIQPGTERKPVEQRPRGGAGERREGPPRGRRPGGPPPGQTAGEGRGPAQGAGHGGRPPRGRPGDRRPPARSGPPSGDRPPAPVETGAGSHAPSAAASGPASAPPPPPRKPRRQPPKPKLTQAALEGKVPLRTFGELSALFAAKKTPPAEPAPTTPPQPAEPEPVAATEASPSPAAEPPPPPA